MGEICIKTGSMMSGYLGDDDDDDVSRARFDPEGFFRTGDLGWYDPAGVLHYSDRAKDVIKVSSNLHVSPAEVEQIIREWTWSGLSRTRAPGHPGHPGHLTVY